MRPDKTNIDLQFHNDNSYNFMMPEFVGLLCVLWVVHAILESRHRDRRDPAAVRARERRGF